jgi:uncharacterized membrane-anchored protein
MKRTRLWIFGWMIVVLGLVNYSIVQKEHHLAHGTTVCLALAPVDPRSMMQGDYMALHFALSDTIHNTLREENTNLDRYQRLRNCEGHVLLNVEANCSATFADLFKGQKMQEDQVILRYRVRRGKVKIATNAFFFEEGTAYRYTKARYGIFKLLRTDPLLVDLAGARLAPLSAATIR